MPGRIVVSSEWNPRPGIRAQGVLDEDDWLVELATVGKQFRGKTKICQKSVSILGHCLFSRPDVGRMAVGFTTRSSRISLFYALSRGLRALLETPELLYDLCNTEMHDESRACTDCGVKKYYIKQCKCVRWGTCSDRNCEGWV